MKIEITKTVEIFNSYITKLKSEYELDAHGSTKETNKNYNC